MKDLIIIIGTILLGTIIFNMIASDENSLKSASLDKLTEIKTTYEELL